MQVCLYPNRTLPYSGLSKRLPHGVEVNGFVEMWTPAPGGLRGRLVRGVAVGLVIAPGLADSFLMAVGAFLEILFMLSHRALKHVCRNINKIYGGYVWNDFNDTS